MNPRNFFAELKRRNVYKVAVAYAVVGWLVMQVSATIVPALHLPQGITTAVVVLVLLGFPIALVIAWAFEMTPQGLKRTENVSPGEIIPSWSRRKFAALIVTVALVAAALLVFQFVRKQNPSSPSHAEADAAASEKSIAILPFENATGDANLDYLSDGVSESVIDRLSQLPQLKVIARSSSFQYRKPSDLKAVASTLGVRTVVTGRVNRRDESYIIRVDLTDARADRQLWGGNFTRKVSEVRTLQTDISREIADILRLRLSGAQIQQLASQTANPEAYELLLKGRFYFNKAGTVETHDKAVEYYEQAVAVDPAYALAYAELADSYGYGGGRGLDEKQRQIKRRAAAQKAFELDPNLAEAHFALANIKKDAWEWPEAEREYRRAIELNPNLWRAHSGYATYISLMRRHDEAIAEIKLARELDPLSLIVNANVGTIFYRARRNEEAIAALKKTLELDPNYSQVHRLLGQVYAAKGMNREAIREFQEAIRLRGLAPLTEALLGAVFVKAGERARAEEILQKLKTGGSDVAPMDLAILQDALGNRDDSIAILEKAFVDRDENLPLTAIEPYFDSLRSDPRLEALLRRMGLQP